MKRASASREQYRSTGWCKALGAVQSANPFDSAARSVAARKANAAARAERMDAIIDRLCVRKISLKERGQS